MGLAYHLECTELLSFLDMLQDGGAFVVGNVNYMYLESLGAGCPLQFTPYVGEASSAAILCLAGSEGYGVSKPVTAYFEREDVPVRTSCSCVSKPVTSYFRRKDVPVRTPCMDSSLYADYKKLVYPPGSKMRKA